MSTIAIAGAGAGLGQSIASRFGRKGYAVALVSRNAARLEPLVADLTGAGIEADAFPADVTDRPALRSAWPIARLGRAEEVAQAAASTLPLRKAASHRRSLVVDRGSSVGASLPPAESS